MIAGIDRPRINGLRIDHGGADDEADRDRELGDDQDVPEPPRPRRLGGGFVRLQHLGGLEAAEVEGGIDAARGADQQSEHEDRQQHPVPAEILHAERRIEEGRQGRQQQLHHGERKQHRDGGDQHRFGEELGDQLLAVGAEYLPERHLAGALARAGRGKIGEIDAGHAQDEEGDDHEGVDRRPVIARLHAAVLGGAEVDVADVGHAPVLVGAGIVDGLPEGLVGDVAALPGRQLRLDRGGIGAGPQGEEHPARLATPAGQEGGLVGEPARQIDAGDHREADRAVQRQVADHAGHPIVVRAAARGHRQGLAHDILAAVDPPRLALGQDDAVGLGERGARIALGEGELQDVEEEVVDQQHMLGRERLRAAADDGLGRQGIDHPVDLREIRLQALA